MNPKLAIIGGSGLYAMAGVQILERRLVPTPFGPPSDSVDLGTWMDVPVAFLSRHGAGHRLLPSEVPYRANLWALKSLGVQAVISVSAVGSLQQAHPPGSLRLPDQFIDRTRGRASTFFGEGLVAHVGLADPTCPWLRARLLRAGQELGLPIEDGGTYVCMEGPGFSTRAESRMHRALGADFIGMTQATEAKLAREAELCYATLALVTDYDAWREREPGAEGTDILVMLHANIQKAQQLLAQAFPALAELSSCACQRALETALITPPDRVPESTKERLSLFISKHGY